MYPDAEVEIIDEMTIDEPICYDRGVVVKIENWEVGNDEDRN